MLTGAATASLIQCSPYASHTALANPDWHRRNEHIASRFMAEILVP